MGKTGRGSGGDQEDTHSPEEKKPHPCQRPCCRKAEPRRKQACSTDTRETYFTTHVAAILTEAAGDRLA